MNWYNLIKRYYDRGYYSKEQVAVFVVQGKITPEQYETITGQAYIGGE